MSASNSHVLVNDMLGPILPILARDDVTDVCINGPGLLFVESTSGWERMPAENLTNNWLRAFSKAVASSMEGKIDERSPILTGHLPSGERIQIVLPPAAEQPSITIRRPSARTFTLDELEAGGAFEPVVQGQGSAADHREAARRHLMGWREQGQLGITHIIRALVGHRLNVVISGATGSGKTTLSKAMIAEIPDHERLIAIEDAYELVFAQPNVVRLFYSRDGSGISPVTAKELLVSCLRMKPDRIMLAELRDAEAYYYLRNVNSGHPGSLTTIHANSASAAIEQLMLMLRQSSAGAGLTRDDIRGLVTNLVDVIIQMERKQVTEIHFLPRGGEAA
ncbi:MAG: P-type DNA transfer ATPase VirB11 [Thiohalocapsa sp.]